MPIPFLGPALVSVGGYLGLKTAVAGAATTVASTVGPVIAATVTKAGALATVYIAGKGLEYTCGTAGKTYAELCKNGVDNVACFMRKANEEISCAGATVLTAKVLFDAGKMAYEAGQEDAKNAIPSIPTE